MEAAWAAALEKKVEIVKKSMSNRFAFAFGPLYQVKEIDNVPAEKKTGSYRKSQQLFGTGLFNQFLSQQV